VQIAGIPAGFEALAKLEVVDLEDNQIMFGRLWL
jgi:hypothetical protein